ncbi:MAG TPA: AAA family ATPase [Syntrophomonadaceae bacterium]|nr:AAA family ATPase [Syntrophomonadaceae bacterium]
MKEIAVGSGVGFLVFLAAIGINVMPILLLVFLAGGFYLFTRTQGSLKLDQVGNGVGKNDITGFDQIGGQDSAIKELKEALQFVLKPEEISRMGIRPLKGILLVGPPGTGKTLLARAAANFTSSVFIAASGSEFIEIYAGVGAKRIRQIFRDARKKARNENKNSAIIFIDELDVLGAKRGSHSSHMEYDQTLNQLLVEMDGLSQNEDPRILIVAATNRADLLDPAILRPGRFDRQVQVNLPDRVGRVHILDIHTRNKPLADRDILEEIGRETFGFSGAHLESLANEAAIQAMRENSEIIERHHFSEAVNKVMMGEKLDRRPKPSELERVGIHEGGHALISELLEPGSVASLTITPRGNALGFMRKAPRDDQYLFTRQEMEKQIMVAIAGALAEELGFGERSTGARNDFAQAWNLAQEIVSSGLSSLGIINADDLPKDQLFEECRCLIARLEESTREVLQNNRTSLLAIAQCLHEEENIDRTRFLLCLQ